MNRDNLVTISFLRHLKDMPHYKKRRISKDSDSSYTKLDTWYVYVLTTKDGDFSKIGITRTPANRLVQLQDGNPNKVFYHLLVPFPRKRDAFAVEQQVLNNATIENVRHRGEWVKGNPDWLVSQVLEETRLRDKNVRQYLKHAGLANYK